MNSPGQMNPFLYFERNAEVNPAGVFMESIDQTVTNADALTLVKKIAFEMRRLGMRPGELVALDLPETLSILFAEAVFHEAAISTVLPPGFRPNAAVSPDWLFSSASQPAHTASRVIEVDARFLRQIEENPTGTTHRMYDSDQSIARLVFSSGTTGTPKAIAHTHALAEAMIVSSATGWLLGAPFIFLFGTSTPFGFLGFYASVKLGLPFLMTAGATAEPLARFIARKQATHLIASPAQIASLVETLEALPLPLPHLTTVLITGSVMPPLLWARMQTAVGSCQIVNVYGSTEAGGASVRYIDSGDPFDAGQLIALVDLEIVDDDDQVVPDGTVGRIRYRTPDMAKEYLGDPEATRMNFTDGWFYCGDSGRIRADGGLTLAGRTSEVINVGGVKFNPTQLDLFAVSQNGVIDACSFSHFTNNGVEQVGIALVTDEQINVQTLITAFDSQFGAAAPKLIARIDEIPRNAMGKPLRRVLAEKYREE